MNVRSIRTLAAALILATAGQAQAQGKAPETDGDLVAGKWGVAYFGQRTFAFGAFAGVPHTVDVYTVGVRHWMPGPAGSPFLKAWALDLGVGLGWSSATHKEPIPGGGTLTLDSSDFAFSIHGGLPLALARTRHVTFLVAPELDLTWANGTNEAPGVLPGVIKTDWDGFAVDLGARAGVEVHLGFIGVPELALQGSLGASFRYVQTTAKPPGGDVTDSGWRLGTERPRGLVVGNVAVIYYF